MNTRSVFLRLALCALLLTTASAFAQSFALTGNVPFAFVVNGQTMSAGTYEIRSLEGTNNLLRIFNRTTGEVLLTRTVTSGKVADTDKLVFASVGDRYFLRSLGRYGSGTVELPVRKAELKLLQSAKAETVSLK